MCWFSPWNTGFSLVLIVWGILSLVLSLQQNLPMFRFQLCLELLMFRYLGFHCIYCTKLYESVWELDKDKGGLKLKIFFSTNIQQYFIATKYTNNAPVEYIDNWTQSYCIVNYWSYTKDNIKQVSHKRVLVLAGNLKVEKTMLCLFFH